MDYSALDDETLIRLIVRRQEQALSALYDRYGRLVYSIGLGITNDPSAAEEIAQDVLMRVWQHGSTYQSSQGRVSTWLMRIARNRSIDILRQRAARPAVPLPDWEDPVADITQENTRVEELADLAQQQTRLRAAIHQLSPEQKSALELAYFQGLSHSEIASRTGLPIGTVKTRIRLGMQRLKQILEAGEKPLI